MHIETSRRGEEKRKREKEVGIAKFLNDPTLLPKKPPGGGPMTNDNRETYHVPRIEKVTPRPLDEIDAAFCKRLDEEIASGERFRWNKP